MFLSMNQRIYQLLTSWSNLMATCRLFGRVVQYPCPSGSSCQKAPGRFSSSCRSKTKKSSGKVRWGGRSLLLYPQVCRSEARVSGDLT